jgi:hypothetical protein
MLFADELGSPALECRETDQLEDFVQALTRPSAS